MTAGLSATRKWRESEIEMAAIKGVWPDVAIAPGETLAALHHRPCRWRWLVATRVCVSEACLHMVRLGCKACMGGQESSTWRRTAAHLAGHGAFRILRIQPHADVCHRRRGVHRECCSDVCCLRGARTRYAARAACDSIGRCRSENSITEHRALAWGSWGHLLCSCRLPLASRPSTPTRRRPRRSRRSGSSAARGARSRARRGGPEPRRAPSPRP
jgi:hypothetical protein